MTDRIMTDANGRKYITSEPLPYPPRETLTCEQAVAAERKRCADLCRRPPGWLSADQLLTATEIQLAILKG